MQKINSTGVAAAAAAATAAAVANNNNNSIREHESEHVLNVLCFLLLLSFSFYISTLHVSCFIIAGISKFESSALCVLVFILLCVVVMSQCRIQILVFTLSYHFSFVMSNLLAPYICSLFSWTEMPFGMLIFGVHVCVCVCLVLFCCHIHRNVCSLSCSILCFLATVFAYYYMVGVYA